MIVLHWWAKKSVNRSAAGGRAAAISEEKTLFKHTPRVSGLVWDSHPPTPPPIPIPICVCSRLQLEERENMGGQVREKGFKGGGWI